MVKKAKKLSDEEIEEYKHENYQMMAAVARKPLSELMGETSKSPNYDENYCFVKQMYLKNCIEPISSRQLFEVLRKQGYDGKYSTFRGLLNNYQKYGYIRKTNAKKPFFYVLTDKGKLHTKNPYIAVDENIKRYNQFQNQKFAELINNDPATFKQIYESVVGCSLANTFSSGSSGGYNNEELNSKIYNNDFWKNANEDELNNLINSVTSGKLNEDETELLCDALMEARNANKGSMALKPYNPSKPEGLRKYYSLLVNCINKPVTKGAYEEIPFKFIYIPNKNIIRLESMPVAGVYRNNEDGKILDFDYANKKYFNNNMTIKLKNTGKELEFYYVGEFSKYMITTMSFADYNKALKKSGKQSLKINIQKG